MVRNREEAALASLKTTRNTPGVCQLQTRTWLDAPSAGDRDGDRDADANDGWASEPVSARHFDHNPPRGTPVYFKNKSGRGFGHRALSLGGGKIRSTDMLNGKYQKGYTSTTTIAQLEKSMSLIYVGWSDTITGIKIPHGPSRPPVPSVKPPVKPAPGKKSIEFKIATCNVQSLPKLRTIAAQLNSLAGIHIAGLQEVDPKDYKLAVLKKFPQAIGIGTPDKPRNNTYSCPTTYTRVLFQLERWASHKIYDGDSGISLTRHLTSAVYTHKSSKFQLGHVNLHCVVMKASEKEKRVKMKQKAKAVTFKTVRTHLAHGLPVLVTADQNDKANWFGTKFDGHKVTVIGSGIDKMILIDGDKLMWSVESVKTRSTPSDHDTLRARVKLIQK